MHEREGSVWFSASDLVNFLGCRHATFLDLRQLVTPVNIPDDDSTRELLQQKGLEHEQRHLERLRTAGKRIAEIATDIKPAERVAKTRQAMAEGYDVIYQGVLIDAPWQGYADFLIRIDGQTSKLGNYVYEIADTKLAREPKPKHIIQLCVYADLLAKAQGALPKRLHIVLGSNKTASLDTADFIHYFAVARDQFRSFTQVPPDVSEPVRCAHCEFCRWSERCDARWTEIDHLNQVAAITRSQLDKLAEADIKTLAGLARTKPSATIPQLHPETFERLRSQAALQLKKRETGKDFLEILPPVAARGFARLPKPDLGDIFFDMEGDPHVEDGLEYLFGLIHDEKGKPHFTAFWGHDPAGEKKAFEETVDFIASRLTRRPNAFIYHYASYEAAALKHLSVKYGAREFLIDEWLRKGKLIDLYKVVREGIRISEPRYSIKNLETFYWKDKRSGGITNAGESIVIYEEWRKTGAPGLLEEIRKYNEVDCRSTLACRDWLLGLRPASTAWFERPTLTPEELEAAAKRREDERQAQAQVDRLVEGAPEDEHGWRRTLGHLVEFHRRAAKPGYWAMFERNEMDEEALIDDPECIGGLRRDKSAPPRPEKRSMLHTFRFPAQDFKMREGGRPFRAGTLQTVGEIFEIDEKAGRIVLKIGASAPDLGNELSLIPEGPIDDKVIRQAVQRCADSVLAGKSPYRAVLDILRKAPPRLTGRKPSTPVVPLGTDLVDASIDAVGRLDRSYLLVQGPPGAGKTYTSARTIVALLKEGKRVGVSSNSHKAINNLLAEIETVAAKQKVTFKGVKKSTTEDQILEDANQIVNVTKNEQAFKTEYGLVAGTAWLFAAKEMDCALDYLFIDEAGQVSLANIVAMGTSARNIVLVGDQMQLGQPIQGVHPDESGSSSLEYLLGDHPTVPPDRGIFLGVTHRMHPDVCRFVSDAFYEGRLNPAESARGQKVVPSPALAKLDLPSTGIRFVPVEHEGCTQRCEPETERIKVLYKGLIGQRWIDQKGVCKSVGISDILVVSPYNMQVDLLLRHLPGGARVGTVDKFQGQEAAIVLVSMATSSAADLPRNIEFLFSRNRLNVAISRARCLAVVVASPRLLDVPCNTIEQMRLVDTLCRLATCK